MIVEVVLAAARRLGRDRDARARPRPVAVADRREILERAKARLDRLELYPRPVRIDRVRVIVAPLLFRLPWFRRFDGYAAWGTILLREPPGPSTTTSSATSSATSGRCSTTRSRCRSPTSAPATPRTRYEAEARARRRGDAVTERSRARDRRRAAADERRRRAHGRSASTAARAARSRAPGARRSSGSSRALAPRFPGLGFAEVRYRIKSWRQLDLCIEDARAAIAATGGAADAARRLLDGRRGRDLGGRRPARRAACSGSRRGSPTGSTSRRSPASASTSSTARSTAGCRGSPASRPRSRAAGSSGRGRSASAGSYTLIRGGVHGLALRSPRGHARAAARAPRRGRGSIAAQLGDVRRLNCAAAAHLRLVGSRTFETSRSFSRPRIIHHETSIWKRCRPWRAEAGKAWWLLCQPSPKTSTATTQLLRDSSRERRSRAGRTCGRSSSR